MPLPEIMSGIDWGLVKSHLPFISLMANPKSGGEHIKTPMWTRLIEIGLVIGMTYGGIRSDIASSTDRYNSLAAQQAQMLKTIEDYEARTDSRLEQMQQMLWQIHQGTP